VLCVSRPPNTERTYNRELGPSEERAVSRGIVVYRREQALRRVAERTAREPLTTAEVDALVEKSAGAPENLRACRAELRKTADAKGEYDAKDNSGFENERHP